MTILLTGASGMLAQAIKQEFRDENLILTDVHPKDQNTIALDITSENQVDTIITNLHPSTIINCAAYTAVDDAEDHQELTEKINSTGPANLAKAAKKVDATLVHISTDYVFGGTKPLTKSYTEDDEKHPETVYGKTKLAGEENITKNSNKYYIFRTAWLYGHGGKNFVDTMLDLAKTKDEIKVVNDQHGSPTSTKTLAKIIHEAIKNHIPYGIYHATNEGFTTWYNFTKLIFKLKNLNTKVTPVTSNEYPAKAKRPHNSQLSKAKLTKQGIIIPDYQTALQEYLQET